jgi:type IV secretory pathway VirB6-like protein
VAAQLMETKVLTEVLQFMMEEKLLVVWIHLVILKVLGVLTNNMTMSIISDREVSTSRITSNMLKTITILLLDSMANTWKANSNENDFEVVN